MAPQTCRKQKALVQTTPYLGLCFDPNSLSCPALLTGFEFTVLLTGKVGGFAGINPEMPGCGKDMLNQLEVQLLQRSMQARFRFHRDLQGHAKSTGGAISYRGAGKQLDKRKWP